MISQQYYFYRTLLRKLTGWELAPITFDFRLLMFIGRARSHFTWEETRRNTINANAKRSKSVCKVSGKLRYCSFTTRICELPSGVCLCGASDTANIYD